MTDLYVSLEPYDAVRLIDDKVSKSISGIKADQYITGDGTNIVAVLVYEKYYYRVSNRLTLTVIIDKVGSRTHIRLVSTGGGQGVLFRFDWGASDSMENSVARALQQYIIY